MISAIIHICVGLPAYLRVSAMEVSECRIGTKQVLKALKAGRGAAVYVADDADPMLREPLVGQCRDAGVEVIPVATMKELGKLCQIHVGAACAALLR